jgi:polysaccharide export outer membrane protein
MKTLTTTLLALALLAPAVASAQGTPPARSSQPQPAPGPVGTNGKGDDPAPPRTLPRSADVTPDYRLVPGDKLRVEVYKDPQVSQSVQVRPDGKITLPLANDIMAAGRTPTELRDAIAEALKSYIANPTVTVIVVETVPPVVYVMGEVNNAGPQPLIGRLDVVQALSSAGGFRDFANTKNIRIRRGSKIIKFNYNDAIKGEASPVFLQPGDTVIVP